MPAVEATVEGALFVASGFLAHTVLAILFVTRVVMGSVTITNAGDSTAIIEAIAVAMAPIQAVVCAGIVIVDMYVSKESIINLASPMTGN